MRIPAFKSEDRSRSYTSSFSGYNRGDDARKGAFCDILNMTGDKHPLLSTREERGEVDCEGFEVYSLMSLDTRIDGEIVKNCLVADCKGRLKAFYPKDGELKTYDIANTSNTLKSEKKTVALSGTKAYFFPDKVFYDVLSMGGSGFLEYSAEYPLGLSGEHYFEMVLEPCLLDGSDADESSPYRRLRYALYNTNDDGTKGEFDRYMYYSSAIFEGDTVELAGFLPHVLNGYFNIKTITPDKTSIVIECPESYTQSSGCIYLRREVPEMDYVIAAKNRLWGCRYGVDRSGKCVNEIYASALGDARNWHRFVGVSTDSWSTVVGSPGAFTGAVCVDGDPVFFKEDSIIRVYGSYPGEFTLSETRCPGIEEGSAGSAAFVGDDLYYKTCSGIVRYDGGYPFDVSRALGNEKYKNAVAGGCGHKYYVSMENTDGKRELFVYDTKSGTWYKESDPGIKAFCRCGGELYFLYETDAGETRIVSVSKSEVTPGEGAFDWMCESTRMGFEAPDRKYVSSLQIRLDTEAFSYCDVYIEYDGDGVWHKVSRVRGKKRSALIRIVPRRCDSFKIRLKGRGPCEIRSICTTLEKICGR
ncbi:MAG: hypothetical protein IJA52_03085 [Clostridia bacterium]|nr:hypothetical protein [Clostridia bacterium]